MSRTVRTFALVATLAGLAVAGDRLRARLSGSVSTAREANDVYPLPAPEQVKIAALGYDDAVTSVLWASLLYQYGDHVGKNLPFQYAPAYARTIAHLDPQFRPLYRFLSAFVTMQIKPPEVRQLVETREILEDGTRRLPNDADVWGAYATFMMFETNGVLSDEQRDAWRVIGASAAQTAVELGFRMDTLGFTGAIYLERNGYRDLAIAQLRRAYAIAPNEDTRAKIARKLERLQAANVAEALARDYETFHGRWAVEAPFVSEGTFVLVGPQRDVAACAGKVGLEPSCALDFATLQAREPPR